MKIHEVIVTTMDINNNSHIAPMGINIRSNEVIIKPFKPSKTLDNLYSNSKAVINFIDDAKVFAGIITGEQRDWPLTMLSNSSLKRLTQANTHYLVEVQDIEDDEIRPVINCRILDKKIHREFLGFNRAQFSIIEASVLTSRLGRISIEKILEEIDYLKIGIEKTAGKNELEAWDWIQKKIRAFIESNNES